METRHIALLSVLGAVVFAAGGAAADGEEGQSTTHRLEVQALDAAGAPIEGARVAVTGTDPDRSPTRLTDAGGWARFTLPTGIYRVDVSEEYARIERRFLPIDGDTVLRVSLTGAGPTFEVGVHVTDQWSRLAVPKATIRVSGPAALENHLPALFLADADGTVGLRLPAGRYILSASKAPAYRSEVATVDVADGAPAVLFELRPADPSLVAFRGNVSATDGSNVPDALIYVAPADRTNVSALVVEPDRVGRFGGWLPSGDYALRVVAPGHYVETRNLERNRPLEDLDLSLAPFDRPWVGVEARVHDAAGVPLANASMGLESAPGSRLIPEVRGFTDAEGRFTANVPPGHYELQARKGGFRAWTGSVAADGGLAVISVALSAIEEKALRVLDADGAPVPALELLALDAAGQWRSARERQPGEYHFQASPGPCPIVAKEPKHGMLVAVDEDGCDGGPLTVEAAPSPQASWKIRAADGTTPSPGRALVVHAALRHWAEVPILGEGVRLVAPLGDYQVVVFGEGIAASLQWSTHRGDGTPLVLSVKASEHGSSDVGSASRTALGLEKGTPLAYEVAGTPRLAVVDGADGVWPVAFLAALALLRARGLR